MRYKVGFIGTGGRSVHYAKHYAQHADMEIVAIADPMRTIAASSVNWQASAATSSSLTIGRICTAHVEIWTP